MDDNKVFTTSHTPYTTQGKQNIITMAQYSSSSNIVDSIIYKLLTQLLQQQIAVDVVDCVAMHWVGCCCLPMQTIWNSG